MPKLPDVSKFAEKFDFQQIVDNVKSVISPGSVIPREGDGDPVAEKFIELHELVQNVTKVQTEQMKEISKINNILGALYKKLQEDGVIKVQAKTESEKGQDEPKEPSKPDKPKEPSKPAPEKPKPVKKEKPEE